MIRRALAVLVLLACVGWEWETLRELGGYDVIVVGSEPEAIAAAVAAAEAGASTLLLSEDSRAGGLFVLGQLNVLDLRTQPENLQKGLFERWWRMVGGGHSFDVLRAEAAFDTLLQKAGVEVRLGEGPLQPLMAGSRVIGVVTGGVALPAEQVIDGTAEMDFAAAAGAHYTIGFSSLGLDERMVDTLVFRIDGVDWPALRKGILERGRAYAAIDDRVAWGHFGGYPAAYRAREEGLRLRGLNLGLQDDGSVLVNALLIHGIDPFDRQSLTAGRERAEREAPLIVEYLARELPGFGRARYAGAAPKLYVRETRHLEAQCRLTVDDVLDHLVSPFDIAAGGYPLDVQVLTPSDSGYVFGAPQVYGVPLCITVPRGIDGLWVVGKAAGYDPIAASSARVVPFGMNVAEAVGLAAALGAREQREPAELAADREALLALRGELVRRGAYLAAVKERSPAGPYEHPHYRAYRLMLSRGLAVGGYDNDPRLDAPMTKVGHLYLLSNVLTRFHSAPESGRALVAQMGTPEGPLTLEWSVEVTSLAGCMIGACLEPALLEPQPKVRDSAQITRGESYALAASLARAAGQSAAAPAGR